jgi:hypothetical protein
MNYKFLKRLPVVLLFVSAIHSTINGQMNSIDRLLASPMEYIVLKTEETIVIDGKDNEKEWSRASWTTLFTDIVTGELDGVANETRAKMLWDKDFLYLYVIMEESDIWASLTEHDSSVFQDNAFEIFIDPDGDTHNYFEIQFNAYGTVWDLFMSKPYRNGGQSLSSWDVKGLQKAIHINGTLNDPKDKDNNWSIELAIPFNSIKMNSDKKPQNGVIWRMNLSRVDWDLDVINGKYQRKRYEDTRKLLPAHYTVWSPQGIVNLHYPERYGYILFSEKISSSSFFSHDIKTSKLLLWKYYYLQQEYKTEAGRYATTIGELKKLYPEIADEEDESKICMDATDYQFRVQTISSSKNFAIDEQGEVREHSE